MTPTQSPSASPSPSEANRRDTANEIQTILELDQNMFNRLDHFSPFLAWEIEHAGEDLAKEVETFITKDTNIDDMINTPLSAPQNDPEINDTHRNQFIAFSFACLAGMVDIYSHIQENSKDIGIFNNIKNPQHILDAYKTLRIKPPEITQQGIQKFNGLIKNVNSMNTSQIQTNTIGYLLKHHTSSLFKNGKSQTKKLYKIIPPSSASSTPQNGTSNNTSISHQNNNYNNLPHQGFHTNNTPQLDSFIQNGVGSVAGGVVGASMGKGMWRVPLGLLGGFLGGSITSGLLNPDRESTWKGLGTSIGEKIQNNASWTIGAFKNSEGIKVQDYKYTMPAVIVGGALLLGIMNFTNRRKRNKRLIQAALLGGPILLATFATDLFGKSTQNPPVMPMQTPLSNNVISPSSFTTLSPENQDLLINFINTHKKNENFYALLGVLNTYRSPDSKYFLQNLSKDSLNHSNILHIKNDTDLSGKVHAGTVTLASFIHNKFSSINSFSFHKDDTPITEHKNSFDSGLGFSFSSPLGNTVAGGYQVNSIRNYLSTLPFGDNIKIEKKNNRVSITIPKNIANQIFEGVNHVANPSSS